ncbi:MAG: DnaJ domain-containing protein [Rhizobiales bacterium]|nr:DnaJ domain-containing protein [Hyphomicrobiales bacterium]MBI3673706.1 DnaJ domain-containing protein [Hyphomicrobiales bacterium]
MPNLVLALVIVFGGWWLLRKFGASQPRQVKNLMRKLAGGAIMAGGGLLLVRGSWQLGTAFLALGAGLLGENALFPNGFNWPPRGSGRPSDTPPPPPARSKMSRNEALAVLGLQPGASAEDIRTAYKRLMKDYHPDRGGSDYLAAKINEAKDVLSQELGATT